MSILTINQISPAKAILCASPFMNHPRYSVGALKKMPRGNWSIAITHIPKVIK